MSIVINEVRPFEEYKEMIQDMSKDEMIRGLYDLSAIIIKQENIINEVREKVDNFDVFKEFTFPLMKRDEEQQVISSIDYEWRKSVKKPILEILDKEEEEQYNTYEEQQDYLWENIDEDNVG